MGQVDKLVEEWLATRRRARHDGLFLAREILGFKDITQEYHGPIFKLLQWFPHPMPDQYGKEEQFESGKFVYAPLYAIYPQRGDPRPILPGGRRRLILDPRGTFKSSINVVTHTIQWILNYPNITLLIVHAKLEWAERMLGLIAEHFRTNKKLRELFPDYCPRPRDKDFANRSELWCPARTIQKPEPTIGVTSIDSSITGAHYDVIKFSDIVDRENTKTGNQIASVIESFGFYRNILVRPESWIDVEGTPWDFSDLYWKIVEEEQKKPPERREWQIHVRGIYKKKLPASQTDYRFTPDELDLPQLQDAQGLPVSWMPERFSVWEMEKERLDDVVGGFVFACTPGDASILMADWSDKPIREVRIGHHVVGWSRPAGASVQFENTVVVDKGSLEAEVVRLDLASGRSLYCTLDHMWWNGRKENFKNDSHYEYQTPQVGREVRCVADPIPELSPAQIAEIQWLGGFIDGEGAVDEASIIITQSAAWNGHICERLERCLRTVGIDYKIWNRPGWNVHYYILRGARELRRLLLKYTDMAKRPFLIDGLYKRSARISTRDYIVKVTPLGKQTVYWLQTGTGNYVSQGYASKNSQRLCNPVDTGENKAFPIKQARWITPEDLQRVPMQFITMTIDTAETQKEYSDFSTITTCGWDAYGRCYVMDIDHDKILPDALISRVIDRFLKFKPINVKIEETGYVRGLKPSLQRECQLRGIYPNFEFLPPSNKQSKKDRIVNTLQPYYKRGEILFLSTLSVRDALIKELSQFPTYKRDDILDTLQAQFQNREWFGRIAERPSLADLIAQNRAGAEEHYAKIELAKKAAILGDMIKKELAQLVGENEPGYNESPEVADEYFNKTGGL